MISAWDMLAGVIYRAMASVVYLVSDLLFTSKIREVARQLGLECAAARDTAQLSAAAGDAKLVIVDLRRPDALAALDAISGSAARKVGFVDHERTDVMDAARDRGCVALAKGKFATELPRLLSEI
jgi:hypothetical protein